MRNGIPQKSSYSTNDRPQALGLSSNVAGEGSAISRSRFPGHIGSARNSRLIGFSLVELLVVISILILVVALSLPAINKSIEAADRNRCGANQAKLATAMSSYDSRQGYFPGIRNTLAIHSPNGNSPMNKLRLSPSGNLLKASDFPNFPASNASWFIMILPHVGFSNLFNDVVDGKVWYSNTSDFKTSHDGLGQDVTVCPARADFYAVGWTGKNMHYRANGAGASTAPSSFNRNDGAIGDNANGIYVSLSDVRAGDGASTTLLITENSQERWYPFLVSSRSRVPSPGVPASAGDFTTMGNDNGGYCVHPDPGANLLFGFTPTGAVNSGTRVVNSIPHQDLFPSSSGQHFANNSYAAHPGGVNVAFVDGSWKLLKEDLSPHVYGHLLTHRSVWDGAATYSTNSDRANVFLKCPPASTPYTIKPEDY